MANRFLCFRTYLKRSSKFKHTNFEIVLLLWHSNFLRFTVCISYGYAKLFIVRTRIIGALLTGIFKTHDIDTLTCLQIKECI